jgi:hypothetical protein
VREKEGVIFEKSSYSLGITSQLSSAPSSSFNISTLAAVRHTKFAASSNSPQGAVTPLLFAFSCLIAICFDLFLKT